MKAAATNSTVWLRLARDAALMKQGGRCKYCLRKLSRNDATADHVIPRAANGRDEQSNIVASCAWCNRAKGRKSYADFMALIRGERPTLSITIQVSAALRRIAERGDAAEARILRFGGIRRKRWAA